MRGFEVAAERLMGVWLMERNIKDLVVVGFTILGLFTLVFWVFANVSGWLAVGVLLWGLTQWRIW
jgi:hypothetical protein